MSTPLLQFSFNNTNTNTGSVGYSASLSSNACMITSSPCPNGNAYSLYVPTNEGVTLPTFSINSSFSFCTWLNCSVCDTSDRFCFQLAKNSTDLSTNGLQQQPALMMRGGTLCVMNVGWDGGQTESLVPAYTNGLVTEQTKVLWSLQSFFNASWMHVGVTFNGSAVAVYANGLRVFSTSSNPYIYSTPSTNTYNTIGNCSYAQYNWGTGKYASTITEQLSDFRVYSKQLSSTEMYTIFNNGTSVSFTYPSVNSSLLIWTTFNDPINNTINYGTVGGGVALCGCKIDNTNPSPYYSNTLSITNGTSAMFPSIQNLNVSYLSICSWINCSQNDSNYHVLFLLNRDQTMTSSIQYNYFLCAFIHNGNLGVMVNTNSIKDNYGTSDSAWIESNLRYRLFVTWDGVILLL